MDNQLPKLGSLQKIRDQITESFKGKTNAFNLEDVLNGQPVITRGGRSVTILGYNPKIKHDYKLAGWIDDQYLTTWDKDGKVCGLDLTEQDDDLFMLKEKRGVWVLIKEDKYGFLVSTVYEDYEIAMSEQSMYSIGGIKTYGVHKIEIYK